MNGKYNVWGFVWIFGGSTAFKIVTALWKIKKHKLKCILTVHSSSVFSRSLLANKTAACELLLCDWIAVWFRQTVLNRRLFIAQRPVLKIETVGQRPRADMLAMQLFNKTIWPNMQYVSWSDWFVLICLESIWLPHSLLLIHGGSGAFLLIIC